MTFGSRPWEQARYTLSQFLRRKAWIDAQAKPDQ